MGTDESQLLTAVRTENSYFFCRRRAQGGWSRCLDLGEMNYYITILVGIAIFSAVQLAFVYLNHAHTVEMTGKLADRRSPAGLRGMDAGPTHLALLNETLHNLKKELLQVKSSLPAPPNNNIIRNNKTIIIDK